MTIDIGAAITLPNGQTVKNRLAKGAMTEGLADARGYPTADLIRLYERWAEGGTGLILTGNLIVDRRHLERAGNVILDRAPDAEMAGLLARLAEAGKRNGARMWAQVSHAGRQTPLNINPSPKAPSAIQARPPGGIKCGEPVAMTEAEIEDVIDRFTQAAGALKAAGFDGVQVHSAHGYLLSEFLSPTVNQRTDRWGGPLENRARLLLEIVRRIRPLTGPGFGLSVKLNSADFQRGGFGLEDSVVVAQWLDEAGIDFLEISGGSYEAPRMVGFTGEMTPGKERSTQEREAYFLEFAPRMKAALKRAQLMVTGGFRSVAVMNTALNQDGVDLIGIGRPLCGLADASARAVDGKDAEMPRYEDTLSVGRWPFSARTPFRFVRLLNGAMAQPWYYQNLIRLAADRPLLNLRQLLRAVREYRARDQALADAVRAHTDTLG